MEYMDLEIEQAIPVVTSGLQTAPFSFPPPALLVPTCSVGTTTQPQVCIHPTSGVRTCYLQISKRSVGLYRMTPQLGLGLSQAMAYPASVRICIQPPESTLLQKLVMVELACWLSPGETEAGRSLSLLATESRVSSRSRREPASEHKVKGI